MKPTAPLAERVQCVCHQTPPWLIYLVKDHYFEIVDERAAREYGDIKPVHGDKIVKLAS